MRRILSGVVLACSLVASSPAWAVTIFGIDLSGQLVTFDSAMPQTIVSRRTITGAVGSSLLGLDFRPATGELYALGANATLYTINAATGAATAGGTVSAPLAGSNFGFDFNPTVDRIRVVSDTGQNLRVNPVTGAAIVDGAYTYASGGTPTIAAVGYTNSVAGAMSTMLYGIDHTLNSLALIGSPNGGAITTVGALGVDVGADASFDITTDGQAFLSSGSAFYQVNLATGAATQLGITDGLRSIAVGAVPEPASWAMMIGGFGLIGGSLRRRHARRRMSVAHA